MQIFIARRVAGMSLPTFGRRYVDHVDIVIPQGPLFHRYLVSVAAWSNGHWDGFSEQWFESREHARQHGRELQSGEKPSIVNDARSFVGATQFLLGSVDDVWGSASDFLGFA